MFNIRKEILRVILGYLFPSRCLACGRCVLGKDGLCPECFGRLEPIGGPRCAACGRPFEFGGCRRTGLRCPACIKRKPSFDKAMAAVRYNDCARSLLLPFKHGDGTHLAKFMAGLMYGRCRGIVDEADLVAPVPIHFTRLAKRRYNQAALLARFIGRLGGKPVCYGLLARKRMTESQGHMSPEERKRNVAGAFEAKTGFSAGRPRIAGATVLLVDDVMTTGATVQECSRVLKKAGAKAVLVLTFAKV